MGRPRGSRNKITEEVKKLAQSYGPDVIDGLYRLFSDEDNPPAARVAAGKELLDRGFGKATQYIAGDDDKPLFPLGPQIDYNKLRPDVLRALLEAVEDPLADSAANRGLTLENEAENGDPEGDEDDPSEDDPGPTQQ